MSADDFKRFEIQNGQIVRVYEFDDGRWELDPIEADERYSLSGRDVVKTELDDGWLETSIYRDLGGNGIYQEVSETYSRPGNTSTTLPQTTLTSATPTQSIAAARAEDQGLVRLYMAVFDRRPDEDGFRYWDQQLERGMRFEEVIDSFLISQEFQTTYSTLDNAGFINQLYLNVLDRQADQSGLNWWMNQLDSQQMQRQDVVRGFSDSAEFIRLTEAEVNSFIQSVGQAPASELAF